MKITKNGHTVVIIKSRKVIEFDGEQIGTFVVRNRRHRSGHKQSAMEGSFSLLGRETEFNCEMVETLANKVLNVHQMLTAQAEPDSDASEPDQPGPGPGLG